MSLVRVSGIGAVCHAGATVPEVADGMRHAAPAPAEVRDVRMDAPVRLIYLAAGSEHERDGTFTGAGASRAGGIAALAALEAVRDAGPGPADPARIGVAIGSCMGASGEHERAREQGEDTAVRLYGLGADVAAAIGANGPVVNIANACAAGAYAVGHALDLLEDGECDRVVVVGCESYSRVALGCFNQMSALDAQGCRPFTVDRRGTAFGEGAGALVLDRVEAAGADDVLLVGAGFSCDAGHATAPAAEGVQARRALADALEQAGLSHHDVDLVVPHGTGTQLNDQVEADMFSDYWAGREPAVYSSKSLLGHTGGGAGALSAVIAVLCLRRGQVPGNPDLGQVMEPVSHLLRTEPVPVEGAAVVNAYAFGGNNATLVFRKGAGA